MYLSGVMQIIADQYRSNLMVSSDTQVFQDANEWRRMQDPYDTRTMILLLWDMYVSTL